MHDGDALIYCKCSQPEQLVLHLICSVGILGAHVSLISTVYLELRDIPGDLRNILDLATLYRT
jgi:hypothetical protein